MSSATFCFNSCQQIHFVVKFALFLFPTAFIRVYQAERFLHELHEWVSSQTEYEYVILGLMHGDDDDDDDDD
eukprot:763462-Hanusia_phi.AAC.2